MSRSMVFKVCFAFDVFWEIDLLSPMDSLILIKTPNEYYCHQDVTGVVLCFKDVSRKA